MMKDSDVIGSILEDLWDRSRFVSYFYQAVQFVPDSRVPTLALTCRDSRLVMHYHPEFPARVTRDEFIGLLVHEMIHVVLEHDHQVRPGGDIYLQNLAQDMVVNSFLMERRRDFFSRKGREDGQRLTLPAGLPLIPRSFKQETGIDDPSWHQIYVWLKSLHRDEIHKRIERIGETASSPFQIPDASFMPSSADAFSMFSNTTTIDIDGIKGLVFIDDADAVVPTGIHAILEPAAARTKEAKKGIMMHIAEGDIECRQERSYTEVRSLIERLHEEDTSSWRRILRSIVDNAAFSNEFTYTYGRFNRRYAACGIYAPGRVFKERELITVAVDLSGSMVMTPRDIEAAFGVVESLLDRYRIHLVCLDEDLFIPTLSFDADERPRGINRPYVYRKGDWKRLRSGSGGTTMFAPLFNRYLKGHRETVMVITDGYIYDLDRLRKHSPTIWVIAGGRRDPFHPPFGRVVKIDDYPHTSGSSEE